MINSKYTILCDCDSTIETREPVEICPKCGSDAVQNRGTGVQKVELIAQKLFPDAKKAYLVQANYEEKMGYLLDINRDKYNKKLPKSFLQEEEQK